MVNEMDVFRSRVRHTFANQWNGFLGDFWYKNAREEVERLYNQKDEMIIEEDGAVRWKSNGNYLPDDCMEKLEYAPYDLRSKISREATKIKRDIQTQEFLEEYREQTKHHVYTEEELKEMRDAFGAGATVVDVFAGTIIHIL